MFESYKETSVARQRELARHLTNDVVSIAITNAYFHSAFYDLSQISWTDLIIDREARSSLLGTERISVTVTNRPVGEVLRSIADQLNLDMKIQGGVVLMTKKTMGIPNNHMNECLKTIAFVVAYTAAILFGHAGLCSSVVGIISGIVTAFFFIVIFVIAAPIARSSILNRWPRRMAKSVLVLQTLVLSWIIAAVIAAVAYQDEWEFSVFWLVPVPFLLSFLLFVRWIRRLGNKKGTEQINGQISSESARSNEVSS